MPDSIININDRGLYLVHADTPLSYLAQAIQEGGDMYSDENYTAISENVGITDLSEYLLDNFDKSFLSNLFLYLHGQCPEIFNSITKTETTSDNTPFKAYNLREYLALHKIDLKQNGSMFCIVSNDVNFAKLFKTMVTNKTQGKAFIDKLTEKPSAYNSYIKPINHVETFVYREAFFPGKTWEHAYPIEQFLD